MIRCSRVARAGVFLTLICPPLSAAETLFSVAGGNPAAIQGNVDAFRTSLGALNQNLPGSVGDGRREINWETIPDTSAAPGEFAPNYFNAISPRGAILVTGDAETTFSLSADSNNPSSTAVEFAHVNVGYATIFAPFSLPRLFSPIGSPVYDVEFVIPGSSTPAAVRGFGAVFCDVDVDGSTSIEFFRGNESLREDIAPSLAGDASLSFVGVDFGESIVTRVRITSGNGSLGLFDVTQAGSRTMLEFKSVVGDAALRERAVFYPDGVRAVR